MLTENTAHYVIRLLIEKKKWQLEISELEELLKTKDAQLEETLDQIATLKHHLSSSHAEQIGLVYKLHYIIFCDTLTYLSLLHCTPPIYPCLLQKKQNNLDLGKAKDFLSGRILNTSHFYLSKIILLYI